MIILFLSFNGVDQGRSAGFKVNLTHGGSIVGIDKDVCLASLDQEFVDSIGVKIEPSAAVKIILCRNWGRGFQFIGQAVCLNQVGDQCRTQVRCVKSSEDAMPVSVIALGA